MTTLKQLKKESTEFYTANAATYFSVSFSKKMGGTQTISFEDDFIQKIEVDKRDYYSGRGAKYNSPTMHQHIDVLVSKSDFDKKVTTRAKTLFERQKEELKKQKALTSFCEKYGLSKNKYREISIHDGSVFFEQGIGVGDELDVDLTDFYNASGKTYFFAESKIGLLLFYHNHRQSFSFNFATEEEKSKFYKERKEWTDAPYAHLLGQNDNKNLFVC